jgi:hypothetical protein
MQLLDWTFESEAVKCKLSLLSLPHSHPLWLQDILQHPTRHLISWLDRMRVNKAGRHRAGMPCALGYRPERHTCHVEKPLPLNRANWSSQTETVITIFINQDCLTSIHAKRQFTPTNGTWQWPARLVFYSLTKHISNDIIYSCYIEGVSMKIAICDDEPAQSALLE